MLGSPPHPDLSLKAKYAQPNMMRRLGTRHNSLGGVGAVTRILLYYQYFYLESIRRVKIFRILYQHRVDKRGALSVSKY